MPTFRGIIILVILIVIAIALMPTVWDAVWTDAAACRTWNTSYAAKDCRGNTCTATTCCIDCVNGTAWTLLKLGPMIFVGVFIMGGILLAYKSR